MCQLGGSMSIGHSGDTQYFNVSPVKYRANKLLFKCCILLFIYTSLPRKNIFERVFTFLYVNYCNGLGGN